MKTFKIQPNLKVGTILTYSIGCGCDTFYQVVGRSEKSCMVRRISSKVTKRYKKFQSCDIVPVPDSFEKDTWRGHDKPFRLALKDDQIGPIKRMIWWSIYEPKRILNQYSP